MRSEFWQYLQQLVESSQIEIDRPKGSEHPHYKGKVYPVDYGYLKQTSALDQGGVDIWRGSTNEGKVTGVLCTVDLLKRDTELKILLDCTEADNHAIEHFANDEQMRAIIIERQR